MAWARKDAAGAWVEDVPPDDWEDDQGRVWDLRSRDVDLMAYCGWQRVAETARPDDTDTVTYDRVVELDGRQVQVVWRPRPWTTAETAAQAAQSARLVGLEERVAALEALVLARLPAPVETPVWDGGPVEPGGRRIILGAEVVNVSGGWLTKGPSQYPAGWRRR